MFRKLMMAAAGLVLAAAAPAPAQARWFEGSSRHFVVYSEEGADDVRLLAAKLERFDAALRFLAHRPDLPAAPGNRVSIFMVPTVRDVQHLLGGSATGIGGFYVSQAGASYAIIPAYSVSATGQELTGETTLLHEYAHHFAWENRQVSYPRWLDEGFAEFVSTARFEKDGSVGLGLAGRMRDLEFKYLAEVPAPLLLDTSAYTSREMVNDQFYPRSWLLFHMLTFAPARQGQLDAYMAALVAGQSDLDAATGAFGDLRKLDRDLDAYARNVSLPYFLVKGDLLPATPIAVRELDEAAAAAMPLYIRVRRGMTGGAAEAEATAAQARELAARYPSSAFVLTALAMAERYAGNRQAALAAAEQAGTADPGAIWAFILKGQVMLEMAEADGAPPPRWAEIRAAFLKANALDNDHPLPLYYYYRTYVSQGFRPPATAVAALEKANELAPYDSDIRSELALSQLDRGQNAAAVQTLRPLTRNAHSSGRARRIEAAIARIEQGDVAGAREVLGMSTEDFEKRYPAGGGTG